MIPPKIAPLPPAPVRADAPVDFSTKADAMVGALQPFANQANDLADFVNDRADSANASATSVAGVQSAVSADRVLSQQAASNSAGSAAAALNSENNAGGSATEARLSANASNASAVRAENAAEYVEGISGGAAPINNPNFQGVVKVNNVPLGTTATRDVGESSGNVMEVGAFGLGGGGNIIPTGADLNNYLANGFYIVGGNAIAATILNSPTNQAFGLTVLPVGAYSDASSFQILKPFSTSSIWTRYATDGSWSRWFEIIHSGNILTTTGRSTQFPMTQKAVTDAIAAAVQYENIQRNAAATGTVSINLANASEFDLTLTGNTTIVFDGSATPAGKSRSFVVRIRQGATARTLTWPASVTWLVVGPITTPAANKICEYVFSYSAESGWFGRIGASN